MTSTPRVGVFTDKAFACLQRSWANGGWDHAYQANPAMLTRTRARASQKCLADLCASPLFSKMVETAFYLALGGHLVGNLFTLTNVLQLGIFSSPFGAPGRICFLSAPIALPLPYHVESPSIKYNLYSRLSFSSTISQGGEVRENTRVIGTWDLRSTPILSLNV